jgi:hypothetical protein
MRSYRLIFILSAGSVALAGISYGAFTDKFRLQGIGGTVTLASVSLGDAGAVLTQAPTAELQIQVCPLYRETPVWRTRTNADGSFQIPLPPGKYVLQLPEKNSYHLVEDPNHDLINNELPFTVHWGCYTRADIAGYNG